MKDSQIKRFGTHALTLLRGGVFDPIPLIPNSKKPAVVGWPSMKINEPLVREMATNGYTDHGIGHRCGVVGGTDIDILDEEVSKLILEFMVREFFDGKQPLIRYGKRPKLFIPCLLKNIDRKLTSNIYTDKHNEEHSIEILAKGQQVVIYACHPDTHQEYAWENGFPEDLSLFDLHSLALDQIEWLFDFFDEQAEKRGWQTKKDTKKPNIEQSDDLFDGLKSPTASIELLKELLLGLQQWRCDEYNEWVKILSIVNYEMQGSSKGLELVERWSQKSKKYGNVEKTYRSLRLDKTGRELATVASLVEMYKQDNNGKIPSKLRNSLAVTPVEWQEPISLDTPEPPRLDPDDLLPVFGDMVKGVAAATETPVELATLLGLATLAAACQKRFIIMPEAGYFEPLNLWTLTLLEPGNRKSAVQHYLSKPLLEWERKKAQELEPQIEEALIKKRNHESRISTLRSKYAKAKPRELAEIEKELFELEKNPVKVPNKVQIWAQDITPEKLGAVMADNDECIAILSAEGGIFENIGGRYSGSVPNLDIFLQAHSGDSARVDRGSREAVYMASPALTMGLSAQPGILNSLARHKGFRHLGLWARFLFALPPSPLGYRSLQAVPLAPSIREDFRYVVHKLLNIVTPKDEFDRSQPYVIFLSPQAHQLWKSFSLGVEAELADDGEFEHIRDWAGKLPGQATRIAGILHCTEHADGAPWKVPVSEPTMQSALNIAATLSRHALAVFHLMGTSQELHTAQKIWNWIGRNRFHTFSKRDCHQALRGSFPKVADLMPGISLLAERYHIRAMVDKSSNPGRKSELYEINPTLTEQYK